jgi:hypothetical protein
VNAEACRVFVCTAAVRAAQHRGTDLWVVPDNLWWWVSREVIVSLLERSPTRRSPARAINRTTGKRAAGPTKVGSSNG